MMTDIGVIKISLILDVERTIAELKPPPKAAALVTMARLYAAAIDEAGGSQNSLKEIGPKLTAVLVALGAGKVGSAAALPEPAAVPEVVEARQSTEPTNELDRARARRRQRVGGGST